MLDLYLPLTDALAMARFINAACATGGVNPTDPLLFTCAIYGAVLLRVVLPSGDREIISIGDTAADITLPTGFTAVSLNITEIDDSRRNFNITISIANAFLLGGECVLECTDIIHPHHTVAWSKYDPYIRPSILSLSTS